MEPLALVPHDGHRQQDGHRRLPGRPDQGGAGLTGAGDLRDPEIAAFLDQLVRDAERSGYRLNPDRDFALALAKGLLVNQGRYGYLSCPCRLAGGRKDEDLDIVCPCDYRDQDLGEFGSCYCGLYVSDEVWRGLKKLAPVPERRPAGAPPAQSYGAANPVTGGAVLSLKYPVWRCKVCGYLCARDEPPGACPVCKADRDRFERFI